GNFAAFDRTSAGSIGEHLGVPRRIANRAVTNSDSSAVPLRDIQEWWQSIYSRRRNVRGIILGTIENHYEQYRALPAERDAWRQGHTAQEDLREAMGNQCTWPNLSDWLLLTGRSWHFRSGRFFGGNDTLVALDNAIRQYEQQHSEDNREAIRTAFEAWQTAN